MVYRYFLFILCFLNTSSWGLAQVLEPAKFSYVLETDTSAPNRPTLVFQVAIDEGWYMYSSDFDEDLGPIVTTFDFTPHGSYERIGEVRPVGAKRKFDDLWGGEYTYFSGQAIYRQQIKVLERPVVLEGICEYQVCTDAGKCILFEESFSFVDFLPRGLALKQRSDAKSDKDGVSSVTKAVSDISTLWQASRSFFSRKREGLKEIEKQQASIRRLEEEIAVENAEWLKKINTLRQRQEAADRELKMSILYFEKLTATLPAPPSNEPDGEASVPAVRKKKSEAAATKPPARDSVVPPADIKVNKQPTAVGKTTLESIPPILIDPKTEDSLWGFFILSLLAGLAALLTPCVFPLIPMTVSYFTKQQTFTKRHAVMYGISIVIIYTLIGFVVAPLIGPEIANELATGWLPNLIFFLILTVFGLSFLGMFELTIPHRWTNFANKRSDSGSLVGLFFMALTLVLVTFSCTGPIVGSILVQAAGGELLMPIVGMMGYSLAFAFPFTFFAIFPQWLSSLPKSGSWLNTVKVSLGFLEIALSIKFLSIADQVYHWGLLDREIYIAIWIVIFFFFALYLLGKLPLPGDTSTEKISVTRLMLSMAVFVFVVYLIPGMFGAPLKALSGYLPPQTTQDFDLTQSGGFSKVVPSDKKVLCEPPHYADILKFPHGIQGYFDYDQAIACARKLNKPLFIDFTGHGCVNCREMEARVWSAPEVLERLRGDFVMVALYVDDRKLLPKEAWYVSSYDKKIKKTLGKRNADFQITRYNNNAQPFYVILGAQEELLVSPMAYNLNVTEFVHFLDRGATQFRTRYPQETESTKGL